MRENNKQELKLLEHKNIKLLVRANSTDEMVFNEVIVKHNYEKKEFKILPNEKWLDLGANIGSFAVFAYSKGAYVKSYEPEPNNFSVLKENSKDKNTECFELAVVGNNKDEMTLSLGKDESNHWRHSLYKNKKGLLIKVKCVNINTLITDDIDCIKMDIEGGEIDIFDNVENWRNVKKLVFEYHFDIQPNMFRFFQQMKKLRKHFTKIDYGTFPAGMVNYKFFPAGRIVFCEI